MDKYNHLEKNICVDYPMWQGYPRKQDEEAKQG
jgi:hypothetical protein